MVMPCVDSNGNVLLSSSGTNYKYVWQGGNSYTSSTFGPSGLSGLSTEGISSDPNGNIYLTCYNCDANGKGSYTVIQISSGGTITTIQNGDNNGSEGPWGGGVRIFYQYLILFSCGFDWHYYRTVYHRTDNHWASDCGIGDHGTGYNRTNYHRTSNN